MIKMTLLHSSGAFSMALNSLSAGLASTLVQIIPLSSCLFVFFKVMTPFKEERHHQVISSTSVWTAACVLVLIS